MFQQIHDLLMVKIPGDDEPHQVLLMLDEFYHVGRMDSLISKITISAGYGFRMAIVMQDLAQLDELYGKNTRITTVSGSQIKLFIQINDLETSDFVSEMLGETTQVYKTPIQRPGQGIFAPRVWSPHYTPRPLRSPLELREMSARLSILMVKNSPSFELTKIRHYLDKPYRGYYERARSVPPPLPRLRVWHDESLQGAINPGPDTSHLEPTEAAAARAPARSGKVSPRRPAQTSAPKAKRPSAAAKEARAPLVLTTAPAPAPQPRKALELGAGPPAPSGETCNVRDILAAARRDEADDFAAMTNIVVDAPGPRLRQAEQTLKDLHSEFGEER
nr:type IV secretory system conjugative DNA transfer family protein [Pleomorphomonas koreensis]